MESKFQVGDKVTFGGVHGEVVSTNASFRYPILCNFNTRAGLFKEYFTDDGRMARYHTEPSLKLISRCKRKVTKWLWASPSGYTYRRFMSEGEAVLVDPERFAKKLEWSATEFDEGE